MFKDKLPSWAPRIICPRTFASQRYRLFLYSDGTWHTSCHAEAPAERNFYSLGGGDHHAQLVLKCHPLQMLAIFTCPWTCEEIYIYIILCMWYNDVMSCHVMSCDVMWCHVMSCHVASSHVISCHVMSCHVSNIYIIIYNIRPYYTHQCNTI